MRISKKIAEKVGFEPTLRFWRKHALQACALDHSAISPVKPIQLTRLKTAARYKNIY